MGAKKKLVPKLRFPEFRDSGEWEVAPLGEKVDLLSGFPFKSADISDNPDGIPLMRGINITEGFIRHSSDIDRYFLGDDKPLEKYKLQERDLVIGMDGSKVGKNSALITEDDVGSLLIQRVARLRAKCEATIRYIFQHIHSSKFHSYVDRINTSGGIPHISAKQINEFEICFPRVEKEQQKIADCLSSLDALIAAQADKIDALKAHKKGLMQQLFPREGETVPRLRFPEFRDAGEWEKINLGSVGKVSMCKRVLKSETKPEGDVPFYKIGTFGRQADAYIDKKIFEYYKDKYSYPKKGEILISAAGTIGRLVVFDGNDAYFQDSNIVWISNDEDSVTNAFLFYCYQRAVWTTDDNTIARLYNDNLRAIEILICSIPEQQRIADCLSSLDALIAAQTKKLDALNAHKKGLMQQLFPSLRSGVDNSG